MLARFVHAGKVRGIVGAACALVFCHLGNGHSGRVLSESITDRLVVALSSGPILLTDIGHPSYARPDILGPTVHRAFRVAQWVQSNIPSRIGASAETLQGLDGRFQLGGNSSVKLKGLLEPVTIHEIVGE